MNSRTEYMRQWRKKNKGNRERAIAILGYFKSRIKTREFFVTKAEWYVSDDGNTVNLNIDANVQYSEDLDSIPE